MADLEQSEVAWLAPKAVKWWRVQMEEALAKDDVRARLAKRKTRKEALEAVRVYLKHAMDGMGQPFLGIAANSFPWRAAGLRESQPGDNMKMPSKLQTRIDNHEKQPPNGPAASDHDRCSVSMVDPMPTPVASKVTEVLKTSCADLRIAMEDPLEDALAVASMVLASRFDVAPIIEEPLESQPGGAVMSIDGPLENLNEVEGHESIGEGCVAANQKEACDQDGCSLSKHDRLPSSEVRNVSEALKTSCANLATDVEDPLPDAVITASNILASRFTEAQNDSWTKQNEHVSATEIGTKVSCPEGFDRENVCCTDSVAQLSRLADLDIPDPRELEGAKNMVAINAPEQSIEEGSNATFEKGTNTIYLGNKYNLVPRPSLMERNQTAHTFKWDEDSIDSPTESSLIEVKKRGLPSSMRKEMSLLKLPENNSLIKQRIRKKWTLLEEDTLRQAVEKYGVGNWTFIQSIYKEIFEDRMPGDLKDKWRNMTKH